MSSIKIDLSLEDSKGTIRRRKDETKELNNELERAQRLSNKGMSGGSAVKSGYMANKEVLDKQEYNRARGTAGNTGAGARDFARQAQGLDGLVRLYAVYAANLFAVSAAFTALSDAMNTTNMIKGLNQLGAASGVAMGSLAKQFAAASGGAISLRESLEATAKAISSGLTQSQFLKLGDVAKKASQALGVNMSDAVSRLTRGITKLEPELLDELGIFTKVGKATEDYARNIGKPVSALTDFERRQAFANAVLEEGAKKFGQIDIDTNPYDKLLATLKNVAQAGLEIVNTVLGPFAKLLSNNTGLLVGAVGLIGVKLVKDALPAIGQWRSGLKDAADEARKRSSDIAASFGESFVERTNAAFKIPQLESNLKKSEEAYRTSRGKMASMDTEFSRKVLKGGPGMDDKALKSEQTRYSREINELKRKGLDINNAQILALQKERALIIALRGDMKALNAAQDAALNKASGGSLGERAGDFLRASSAKGARDTSRRLDIISSASANQKEKGFGPAISLLMKDLDTLPGKFNKVRAGIGGIVVAGAGAIGTAISGLSRFLGPVGVGLSILTAALPLFRSNEEESARFAASLDLLKENSENAFRVFERLSKLDPLERISVDSIFAKGTALESLGGSMSKAFTDIETEIKNRNWADSTLNFLSSIIGRSSEQLLAKQIGNSVENAVKLSANGPNGKVIQEDLAKLLELPAGASLNAINQALKKANPEIQQAATKIVEDSGKKAVASAGSLKTFREGLVESGKIYQDLLNTTKNSTPLTKFAEDSSKQIIELSKVLAGAQLPEKLSEMSRLSTDINFLQLFPVEAASNILSTSTELSKLSAELAEVESKQTLYNNALNDQQKIVEKYAGRRQGSLTGREADQLATAKDAIDRLNNLKTGLDSTKGTISTSLESASLKFANSMRLGLIANIDTFSAGLVNASAKATLELKKTALGGIADPRLKAKVQQDIDLKSNELDRKMLEVQLSLIDSQSDLRLAIMENTFSRKLESSGITGTPQDILSQLFESQNKDLLEEQRSINSFKESKGTSTADLRKRLKDTGLSDGVILGLTESLGQAQQRDTLKSQLAGIRGKDAGIRLQGQFATIDANKEVELKRLADVQKGIDQDQLELAGKKDSMSDAEFKKAEQLLIVRKANSEYQTKIQEATATEQKARAITGILSTQESEQNLYYATDLLNTTKSQASIDKNLATSGGKRAADTARALELSTEELKGTEQRAALEALSLDNLISKNKQAQDLITQQQQLGLLDENAVKRGLDSLRVEEAKLDQRKQLTAAQTAYNQEIAKLDQARVAAGGYTPGGEKAYEDRTARNDLKERFALQVAGIMSVTEAQIKSAEVFAATTNRQLAYTDMFKQAFKGMEDAIVEFTKTGKLSFSSMIESFIEGLLRYEIQQQQMAIFKSIGGAGGLAKLAASFFIPSIDNSISNFTASGQSLTSAKGNAFDYGIQAFAKGGAFTNSIVDSPTMFRFAKGTGLMGEAGPEAIMPLTRDGSGNLGVRANGGGANVDVVVNNYGNEKATTKETVDSRGNRRIEVTVGDMVAQEVTRTGSAAQTAFSSTYGTRPALARR